MVEDRAGIVIFMASAFKAKVFLPEESEATRGGTAGEKPLDGVIAASKAEAAATPGMNFMMAMMNAMRMCRSDMSIVGLLTKFSG
jgi:hypothetical protein